MRINDILSEIETNIEPLKAQSEKAKKYLNIREELKNIEIGLFLYNIEKYKKETLERKAHENATHRPEVLLAWKQALYHGD